MTPPSRDDADEDSWQMPDSTSGLDERRRVPDALCLTVVSGPDRGQKLELSSGLYWIGKHPRCALVLTDHSVSRRHLEVSLAETGVVLRDLESLNGSYFEGARFQKITISPGDTVRIGESELKLMITPSHPPLLPSERDRFGRLVGSSLRMRELYAQLEQISASNGPVLIQGETGTGKELCAEAIHNASDRAHKPFVICDLAGIAPTLIESELFGYERGAFTGANRDYAGLFEVADGGTLFLDELGELDLAFQPRLLRMLESGQVRRVGATRYRHVDVRFIAATNRDLASEVRARLFRADLYHRLALWRLTLPPLRERKSDLPVLVQDLLRDTGITMSASVLALLSQYEWPGNVRELANVIERARVAAGAASEIELRHVGLETTASTAPSTDPADFHLAKQQLLDVWEREYLRRVLDRTGGNISQAARETGLGRTHLYRLLRKHRFEP